MGALDHSIEENGLVWEGVAPPATRARVLPREAFEILNGKSCMVSTHDATIAISYDVSTL